jgi:hypothetical protein
MGLKAPTEELLAALTQDVCNGFEFCCHSSLFYSNFYTLRAKVALDAVDDDLKSP